jgi:hypothetical protein
LIDITPDIALDPNTSDPTVEANTTYTITVFQPNHGMVNPGETVTISGALAYKGIPANTLNSSHVVSSIIDASNYTFELAAGTFNLENTRVDTKGGAAVKIIIPDFFRLRFDQPDTMGTILGFRNVNNISSIFPFATEISNNDPYEFEIGYTTYITNNAIQLSGDNYTIMVASPLVTLSSIGPIKDAFAKIQLSDSPGKVLFNSYVETIKNYEDPVNEVVQLSVAFYTPDGNLYNFYGLDHSYTIELTIVNDIPEGTGINASTGRNYNQIINF